MTTSTIRTKDQLAVLLKLIEVNKVGLTRRNLSIRQRIWQVITQKLNEMQGAEKDVEGWKRSYNSWRLSAGKYFEEERDRIIKDVADDDYFIINVSDGELAGELSYDDGATYLDPKDRQLTRLHELISQQRLLFISTSEEDEPLRQRLWQNIADELNNIPDGIKLPKEEWQKRVDLRQYAARRGRKRKNVAQTTTSKTRAKVENNEIKSANDTKPSDTYESTYEEYIIEDFRAIDKPATDDETATQSDATIANDAPNDVFAELDGLDDAEADENTDDIIKLLNGSQYKAHNSSENFPFDIDDFADVDGDEYNLESDNGDSTACGKSKRTKLTPIVKSFKYSNQITTAVEQLKEDVKESKDMLKQTTNLLERMCSVMEEHNKKQEETNKLLKRNGQLLKILVEYKCGMRGSGKK